jgi:hypothetical protein
VGCRLIDGPFGVELRGGTVRIMGTSGTDSIMLAFTQSEFAQLVTEYFAALEKVNGRPLNVIALQRLGHAADS